MRSSIINKVRFSLSTLLYKHHYHTPTHSSLNPRKTHFSLPINTIPLSSKSLLSKYYTQQNPKLVSISSLSLKELLLSISHVCPDTCRKLFRLTTLIPDDVVEILVCFSQKSGLDVEMVGPIWEIFKRVGGNDVGFKHLPMAFEVMGSLLVRVGMFDEVESLLSMMDSDGVGLVSSGVFSGVVEGFVGVGEMEKGLLWYDRMKGFGLVPSLSCYRTIVGVLLRERRVMEVIRVYEEMIDVGYEFVGDETRNLEMLVRMLCCNGKVSDARKLIRKIVGVGWKPSAIVLNEVSHVYCEKKDFEDLLSFFVEVKSLPDVLVGNKIIFSLCSHYGVERAHLFLCELEDLGFKPNAITFGILICRSCVDGKLRDAFFCVSEILHRGLKPERHSYNALIGALFKAGLEQHVKVIFNEMIDNGIEPNMSTFRTLLAGYSLCRCFNEVKLMISEMNNLRLISMSPLDDPISKAFSVLGLSASAVKVKRDNNIKSFRTEFVDEIGNGLYLDTNVDEFEKVVTGVLEESFVPDLNLLVMRHCDLKLVEEALLLVDEMIQWGQELSVPAIIPLMQLLCSSKSHIKLIPSLLDKIYVPYNQLDDGTLNLLLQSLSKNGFNEKCRLLVAVMDRKNLPITNATYSALLVEFCKSGTCEDIIHFWELVLKGNWLPEWTDFITILGFLCNRKMLKQTLELCDLMLALNPDEGMRVCDTLVEKLCRAGFTGLGHIFVNKLQECHFKLDHAIYSHLINGYCYEKQSSEALKIFDTIQGDNLTVSPDALSLLYPKLCNINKTETALALKNACLRGHSSNLLCVYAALINGCGRAGNFAEADALFNQLILEKIVPNDEIYNTLLHNHCQISNLKRVKELLCVMFKQDIAFSLSSYRHLIRLMCRNELFQSALGLKRIMLVKNKLSGSIIHNLLIFHLFLARNRSLVDSVLHDLKESGHQLDEVGYNFLVFGYSICNDMSRSMQYLHETISKGFRPTNRSLRSTIRYLCSNGQVEKALELSGQITSKGWIHCSTIQHALVECLVSHGQIPEAVRFLTQIIEKGLIPNGINYDSLIKKFCQYGRTEIAVILLDQMLKNKSIPDAVSYDYIIQSFCICENLDRSMDFYFEMLERGLKPSIGTWDLLTEKLCAFGKTTEAERLLLWVIDYGETPTWKMFNTVVERYRSEKNLSKASSLLHMMQKYGYKPDFQIQWSLISSLSNMSEREGVGTKGFLSKLLVDSGFSSKNGAKFKE